MGHRRHGAQTYRQLERDAPRQLSSWGHLALLAWAWGITLATPTGRLLVVLGTLLVVGIVFAREGLRVLRSLRLWLILIAALAAGALWFAEPDRHLGSIGWSVAGLEQGAWMAARALALLLSTALATRGMSISSWARLFGTLGLPGLGFALGVAFNLLPTLRDLGEAAYHSIRLRGGWRRPWLALRLFLLAMVANGLRYGDEVVKSATSRGFDPNAPGRAAPRVHRADGWLLALLALGTLAVFWP